MSKNNVNAYFKVSIIVVIGNRLEDISNILLISVEAYKFENIIYEVLIKYIKNLKVQNFINLLKQ